MKFDESRSPFLTREEIRCLLEVAFVALEDGEPLYAERIFLGLRGICSDEWVFVFGQTLALIAQSRNDDALLLLQEYEFLCNQHGPLQLVLALVLRDCGYWQASQAHFCHLSQYSDDCNIQDLLRLVNGGL